MKKIVRRMAIGVLMAGLMLGSGAAMAQETIKLAFIGPFFKIGQKVATGGMELWTSVMAGDAKAQKRMEKYCEQDVRLLEKVYVRLLPYIVSHPNIGGGSGSCPRCKSTKRHKRGPRMTAMYRIQRYQCMNCGGWHDGERTKI